ncbi:hypothetical protein BH11PLA2_BH11PLA2_24400 [soil metagenome]
MKEDSRWTLAEGEDDGKTLIFRIRNKAPLFATKATYPNLLAVCWRYESPNDQGMPTQEDTDRMYELENLLEGGLEENGHAFLSVIVTGNGIREWQWYARDPNAIMEQFNKTLGELDPFPIQISFQDDPEWDGYAGFLAILSGEG